MRMRRWRAKFGRLQASKFRVYGGSILLLLGTVASPAYAADAVPPADGQKIYEKSCAKCHDPGMGAFFTGAPKIGTDQWQTRLSTAGSVDALVVSAARGKGKMPAQGGASGLADPELKAAIEYILSKSSH